MKISNKFKLLKKYPLRDILNELIFKIFILFYTILSTKYFKLKALFKNIDIGKNIKVIGNVIIEKKSGSKISLGKNCSLKSSIREYSLSINSNVKLKTYFDSANIIIGKNVHLNGTCITARSQDIIIDDDVMFAGNVVITDSDYHPISVDNRLSYYSTELDKSVYIKKNAWIGLNSIILKGVTIGENSVIGAGSVVTKNIPDNVIAAGNPVKIIKTIIQKES